tara:strand:- start:445 stop:1104 length:660 start_codon:yes stop_codon:yes gene_type:complete
MINPIIVVNANMGSKAHQIGRLIATCTNVLWYNHKDNGKHPWLPCDGILNSELNKFHFDRRFNDNTTIPPVLDYARRSNLPEKPELSYERNCCPGLRCQNGDNLIYVTHSNLDEARDYFKGKHIVVLDKNYDRFMETSWNYKVGKTKKLISELYTEKEVEILLSDTLENYTEHMNSDDFVISSIDDLFNIDTFVLMCDKFNLIFNEDEYNKVKEFMETT